MVTGLSVQLLQNSNRPSDGGNNGGNHYSRLAHIDFPKFKGDDVQGWLYKCEQFFEIDAIVGSRRVKVAFIHLMGRALIWHQAYVREFGPGNWPGWDEYKAAIVGGFGTGPFDDPLAELMKLKQNESVAVYQEKFDLLLNRVDLSLAQAISCFLSGLSDEIQCAMWMFRPASLHEAYCPAKLQEPTLASISRKAKHTPERVATFNKPFTLTRVLQVGQVSLPIRSSLYEVLLSEGLCLWVAQLPVQVQ